MNGTIHRLGAWTGTTRQLLPVAIIILGLLVLGGCSRPLEFVVAGESDLNGGGNAARIHVFQLSSDALFESITVANFWNNPEQALGSEMIGHDQILLYPEEVKPLTIEPEDGTRFIGIAANFREPDPNQWRQVYTLDELKRKTVQVSVGSRQLLVTLE